MNAIAIHKEPNDPADAAGIATREKGPLIYSTDPSLSTVPNSTVSPWLVRGVKSYLRMARAHGSIYLFASLAVVMSVMAAGSIGASVAAVPIGLIATVLAAGANEAGTRRTFAALMPKRRQMLTSQIVTAFILVTVVFGLCALVAGPITFLPTGALAAAAGSYALSYVGVLLVSMLMFFTTVVTRSAPMTFGLIASGIAGVMLSGVSGVQALLVVVPISAPIMAAIGPAAVTLAAITMLAGWMGVFALVAAVRFSRKDFGGQ